MKLKKFTTLLLIAICTTFVAPAFAADGTAGTPTEKAAERAQALQMKSRLLEIKNMDLNNLTKEQRQELKKEVKEMKKDNRRGNGIYLSLGALIIVVLLLILILR